MDTDGGGWTVMAYLRSQGQWDWSVGSTHSGTTGDTESGWSHTTELANMNAGGIWERILIFLALYEDPSSSGSGCTSDCPDNQGKQWMKSVLASGSAGARSRGAEVSAA